MDERTHPATTVAAVQSNKVYPTPPALVRLASFGGASDKRFPLWQDLHNGQELLPTAGCSRSVHFIAEQVR